MNVFDRLSETVVVPVAAPDGSDRALALVDSLAEGGVPRAEITYRTDAIACIHRPCEAKDV